MYQVTSTDIQKAMAEVLSKRIYLPNVSPDSINVETTQVGQYFKIAVRLSSTYKVLPNHEQIIKTYQQSGQKAEGAKWLMLGAVQVAGERLRVTTRIVQTETSVIAKASSGDGDTSYEGLCKAFEIALLNLQIAYIA